MRTIEFRGMTPSGKWVYGDLEQNVLLVLGADLVPTAIKMQEVIPETVGQFTSLLDKNGNKIFEGDLLKIDPFLTPHEVVFGESTKWEYSFNLRTKQSIIYLSKLMVDGCEIIGNIHQNKELL